MAPKTVGHNTPFVAILVHKKDGSLAISGAYP